MRARTVSRAHFKLKFVHYSILISKKCKPSMCCLNMLPNIDFISRVTLNVSAREKSKFEEYLQGLVGTCFQIFSILTMTCKASVRKKFEVGNAPSMYFLTCSHVLLLTSRITFTVWGRNKSECESVPSRSCLNMLIDIVLFYVERYLECIG